jgi:uridylate kinase
MEADVIIKATKVEGVYTADPVKDASASSSRRSRSCEVITRDLKVMDAAAISLCRENDIPIIVLNLDTQGLVGRAVRGEQVGTLVHP